MARAGKNHKGGRPKGKKSKATLEREAILKQFNQRTLRASERLWQAQAGLAVGSTYLFKIEKEYVSTGKGKGFYRKKKPVLVTHVEEIQLYLEGAIENGDENDDQDPAATYYFITAKDPDNRALDSMLDRALGKTPTATKLVDDEGKALPITSISVVPLDTQQK